MNNKNNPGVVDEDIKLEQTDDELVSSCYRTSDDRIDPVGDKAADDDDEVYQSVLAAHSPGLVNSLRPSDAYMRQ